MKAVDLWVVVTPQAVRIRVDDGWSSWPCEAEIADGWDIATAAAKALEKVPFQPSKAVIVDWSGVVSAREMLEVAQAIVAWQQAGA